MTEILHDQVDTTMTINGKEWLVSEAEVELSLTSTPNYVDINKMVPKPGVEYTYNNLPDLIGAPFELHADNELISERDTNAEEETLLFKGNLANISATGERTYEGIAYDPSQQGFASASDSKKSFSSGTLLNQRIRISYPYYGYLYFYSSGTGTSYEPRTIEAKEAINRATGPLGLDLDPDKVDNQLTDGGVTRSGPNGSVTGAYNRDVTFDTIRPKLGTVFQQVAERTESTFWFDKEGVFHFGVPDPTRHQLRLITEASDGMTTPPYQSVKVIGSGISSQEGWSRQSMRPEERITTTWVIARNPPDEFNPVNIETAAEENPNIDPDNPPEPVFTYRNAEISTQEQAEATASKVAEDLAKQQAKGKVTVSGFPEVVPLDAIVMPSADKGHPNYNPRQPMGGTAYSVYKVVHKLNSSDGFKTVIHVAGLVGASRVVLQPPSERDTDSDGVPDSADTRAGYGL